MSERRDQRARGGDEGGKGRSSDEVDRASADSFPASDPPGYSGVTGAGQPDPPAKRPPSAERDGEKRPTGMPTSERHAAETAHQWEDQEKPTEPARGRDP